MFNVSALLLDDAPMPAMPLTNSAIYQMLQFAPLSDGSPASAGWLLWIINIDRPSVEEHPKQHKWPDLSPGCLGATYQARSMLISGIAGLSARSDISQGSVATHLRCGGCDSFITNCLLILTVQEFWKSVNIWWNYKVYKKWCHFFGPPCTWKDAWLSVDR